MDLKKLTKKYETTDLATIQKEISVLMLDPMHTTNTFTSYKFNTLYRARKHNLPEGEINKQGKHTEFLNEKEFWEPPMEKTPKGRCNDEGKPLFYCSSNFDTAIFEVKPEIGNYVTISRFENIPSHKIPTFIIQPLGVTYLKKIEPLKDLFENYDLPEHQFEFQNFLDNLFHQDVKDCETYKYNMSIAIANIFFTDGMDAERNHSTHGLIYPSIIRDKKSYCFALKPWIVRCYFRIYGKVLNKKMEPAIETFKILDITSNSIKVQRIRNGFIKNTKVYPNDMFDIDWVEIPTKHQKTEILYY